MSDQLTLPGIPQKVEKVKISPFTAKRKGSCRLCGRLILAGRSTICFYGNKYERPYIHLKCHPEYKQWKAQQATGIPEAHMKAVRSKIRGEY